MFCVCCRAQTPLPNKSCVGILIVNPWHCQDGGHPNLWQLVDDELHATCPYATCASRKAKVVAICAQVERQQSAWYCLADGDKLLIKTAMERLRNATRNILARKRPLHTPYILYILHALFSLLRPLSIFQASAIRPTPREGTRLGGAWWAGGRREMG